MNNRSVLFWSGGKDCMMALEQTSHSGYLDVSCLLTTYDESTNRVPFHGIHIDLIRAQAFSLQIPLILLPLPNKPSNTEYHDTIKEQLDELEKKGISTVIFGDIFLDDLRAYRESILENTGMKAVFPLWEKSTGDLSEYFLSKGYKAVISGLDLKLIDEKFLGQEYDELFIKSLRSEVDHCGENGEFHTFTYDGPLFRKKVTYQKNNHTKTFFERFGYIELDVNER